MAVLVTGGAGFLGRHIAKAMAHGDQSVTILDDLSCVNSTFDCPELSSPGIRCICGTTLDRTLVADLVAEHQEIFHLASVVGVEETIGRPLETMRNLEGTLHLTEAMTPDHRVVFTSSADVYGLHSHLHDRPMHEDDLQLFESSEVSRWVYPKIKSLEESAILNSAAMSLVVRVFNCFGPGMDFPHGKRVVPQLIEGILSRSSLRISGTGEQTRSFCHYTDTIRGLELALQLLRDRPSEARTVVNIGADHPLSVLAIAKKLNEMALELGMIPSLLPLQLNSDLYSQPFDDSWDRQPDLERARALLGYVPEVSVDEGLRSTLEYYRAMDAVELSRALKGPTPPSRRGPSSSQGLGEAASVVLETRG